MIYSPSLKLQILKGERINYTVVSFRVWKIKGKIKIVFLNSKMGEDK